MIVQLATCFARRQNLTEVTEVAGGWAIVDEALNRLEFLDHPSIFDSEADAVHAAETLMGRWSDAG